MKIQSPIKFNNGSVEFRSLFAKTEPQETRSFFPNMGFDRYCSGIFNNAELDPLVDRCVSLISNTLACCPLHLMIHKKGGTSEVAWYDPLEAVLRDPSADPSESATLFYQQLVRILLVKGNVFLYKGYDRNGTLSFLQIVNPNTVRLDRDADGNKVFYIEGIPYGEERIIHIPMLGEGYGGLQGRSPIDVHRGLIAEHQFFSDYVSAFFKNGLGGSRLLVTLGDEFKPNGNQLKELIAEFSAYYNKFVSAQASQGAPIIAPPGTGLSILASPNNSESEIVDLLKNCEQSICGIFNIPCECVLSDVGNKYDSLSARQSAFLETAIRPLALHICGVLESSLIPVEFKGSNYLQWDFENVIQLDQNAKTDRTLKLLHGGIITLNEAREQLHLSSVTDGTGDVRWMPSSVIPATKDTVDSFMAKSKLALKEYNETYGKDNGNVSDNVL